MMNGGGSTTVYILYKIMNAECDKEDPHFNAFPMKLGGAKGPSLAAVKQQCAALYGLSHLGPDGYHWRVCVEDKPLPGSSSSEKGFSWWDIQDENATLPIKQANQFELNRFFSPNKDDSSSDGATSVAKGAFKSLGKAMSQAVGADSNVEGSGPPISVIAFKLLDLMKMHDDFSHKNQGRGGHIPQPVQQQPRQQVAPPPPAARVQPRTPAPPVPQAPPAPRTAPRPAAQQRPQTQPPPQAPRPQAPRRPQPAEEPNLMDFGPPSGSNTRSSSFASTTSSGFATSSNESRAERLKREYAQKKQSSNRVWDEIDQRWVEVDGNATTTRATVSAPPGSTTEAPKKKEVGISLDPANAAGKAAHVQAAVHQRVNEMRASQAKALDEIRQREAKKKAQDEEEDAVRKRLEPKIKVWSEEHGKKKQLRALLATLHTILWPEAKWKQVTIGDILEDSKVKRCYLKASLVVHPDKTHHLDAEKRFLAKRIFDALSQAKKEFDDGKK